MQNKNEKALREFVEYCQAHPEERFWQALRNWCGYSFVLVTNKAKWLYDGLDVVDTFYWEGPATLPKALLPPSNPNPSATT